MIFDPLNDFRDFSASVGTIAFALLVWRLVGRWPFMSALSRIIVGLLTVLVFITALATARAAALGAPFNEVQYMLFAHYLVTIGTCLVWPRLLDRTGRRR